MARMATKFGEAFLGGLEVMLLSAFGHAVHRDRVTRKFMQR